MAYNREHREEEVGRDTEENVYSEQGRSNLLAAGEIDSAEYGVMRGYEESPAEKVVKDYEVAELRVWSPAFKDREELPGKYTCDDINVNPPLTIEDVPDEAKSLAIIFEDVDSKYGDFTHWLLFNVDPEMNEIGEDSSPGIEGVNSFGGEEYRGPCPESGRHRYVFNVYALNQSLDLGSEASKEEVEQSMTPHIVAEGSLTGFYERSGKV
ncbi:MAG: YbhB/YbcL family Raf kinase inhibitor-like protein [Candidatus Altiarchaeales archaeon]|nr:YbhB/YbcL family Raf kinase inhibitor-like protein [Candidatus Altiarchaeales archaeon]